MYKVQYMDNLAPDSMYKLVQIKADSTINSQYVTGTFSL